MTLPLIQGRVGASALSSYRFAQAVSPAPALGSPFKNSNAVIVSISDEAKKLAAQKAEKTTEEKGPVYVKGALDNYLDALSKVTSRITAIDSALAKDTLSEEQLKSYTDERNSLNAEFERITKSDSFSRIKDTLAGIKSSLDYGTSPQELLKVLQSNQSLLGSGVLGLIGNGNSGGLSQITSIMTSLSGLSSDALANGGASSVLAQVQSARQILSGTYDTGDSVESTEASVEAQAFVAPEIQETQFVSNDKYALSLKGYSNKGLLAAAAAGMDPKSAPISVLTLSIPKDNDELKADLERENTLNSGKLEDLNQNPVA